MVDGSAASARSVSVGRLPLRRASCAIASVAALSVLLVPASRVSDPLLPCTGVGGSASRPLPLLAQLRRDAPSRPAPIPVVLCVAVHAERDQVGVVVRWPRAGPVLGRHQMVDVELRPRGPGRPAFLARPAVPLADAIADGRPARTSVATMAALPELAVVPCGCPDLRSGSLRSTGPRAEPLAGRSPERDTAPLARALGLPAIVAVDQGPAATGDQRSALGAGACGVRRWHDPMVSRMDASSLLIRG